MSSDIEQRKRLSFEQAEGAAPLPTQLKLKEISKELRAVLWNHISRYLNEATEHSDYGPNYMDKPWSIILKG